MLKVNLTDGRTLRYDLTKADDVAAWTVISNDFVFQSKITGISLLHKGVVYALPRPKNQPTALATADLYCLDDSVKGYERCIWQVGPIKIILIVHASQKAARVDVIGLGETINDNNANA